ncbi:hypothetical protein D9M71_330540 [compost metagenome]
MLVVLAGGGQFRAVGAGQRLQFAVAPAVLVGDEDDPAGVADQEDIAALAPFALKLGELQLDHHGTEEAAVFILHGTGQKIARHAAGHTHRIEAAAALATGLFEIWPEAIVGADIGAGQAPVAGGHGQAGAVEQLEGRGIGRTVDALQLAVQGILHRACNRAAQGADQFRVEGQHRRQGAVTFDQGVQRVGIQPQLLTGPAGILDHRLALGVVHGPARGQQGAGKDEEQNQAQTQGAKGRRHGASPGSGEGLLAFPWSMATFYSSSKLCCCTACESRPTWTRNSPGSAAHCNWPL